MFFCLYKPIYFQYNHIKYSQYCVRNARVRSFHVPKVHQNTKTMFIIWKCISYSLRNSYYYHINIHLQSQWKRTRKNEDFFSEINKYFNNDDRSNCLNNYGMSHLKLVISSHELGWQIWKFWFKSSKHKLLYLKLIIICKNPVTSALKIL